MEKNRQLLVQTFFALTFLMVIFPPWNYVDSHNSVESFGYGPFWKPPVEKLASTGASANGNQPFMAPPRTANSVDGIKLLIQIVLLAGVTVVGYVISKEQPRYRKVKG